MLGKTPSRVDRCERVHQWSSLRLDGELSELESALLERHLDVCPACRAFDASLAATAASLRAAPLERPSRPFQAPARSEPSFARRSRLVAVLVAAAVALGALLGSLREPAAPTPQPSPELSFLAEDPSHLRRLPRASDERGGARERDIVRSA